MPCRAALPAAVAHMVTAPLWFMTVASSLASRRPTEVGLGLSSCSAECTTLSKRRCGLLCFLSSLATSSKQLTWYDLHASKTGTHLRSGQQPGSGMHAAHALRPTSGRAAHANHNLHQAAKEMWACLPACLPVLHEHQLQCSSVQLKLQEAAEVAIRMLQLQGLQAVQHGTKWRMEPASQ